MIDVQRISERIMRMKLVTPGRDIVSAYAPQQGCEQWEKDQFWNQLENAFSRIPGVKEVVVAGDLNGHVCMDRTGYQRWHGGQTLGQRNEEGERILEFAQMYDLALVNTFFEKKEQHL